MCCNARIQYTEENCSTEKIGQPHMCMQSKSPRPPSTVPRKDPRVVEVGKHQDRISLRGNRRPKASKARRRAKFMHVPRNLAAPSTHDSGRISKTSPAMPVAPFRRRRYQLNPPTTSPRSLPPDTQSTAPPLPSQTGMIPVPPLPCRWCAGGRPANGIGA